MVEGARLESEARQQHGTIPNRFNAHAISDLAFQKRSLGVRPYTSVFVYTSSVTRAPIVLRWLSLS